MGRIKTQLIKRVSNDIVARHKDTLKKDYYENRAIISQLAEIRSKKLRNVIAGYVTRLMQD